MDRPRYMCFGGGGNHSVAYIGVLQAFTDMFEAAYGVPWHEHVQDYMKGFSGASGGAILALCMCLNLDVDDVRRIIEPYQSSCASIIPNPDISNLIQRFGIEQGTTMRSVVCDLIRAGGIAENTTFERLYMLTRREFVCSGTNLNTRRAVIFSRKHTPAMEVAEAVFISMCIPLIFSPVEYDGDLYVDGALTCNIPCDDFPPCETCVITLEEAPRIEIHGWKAYINQLVSLGFAAQDQSAIAQASRHVLVKVPAHHLTGPRFDIDATIDTEELVRAAYASVASHIDESLLACVTLIIATITSFRMTEDAGTSKCGPGSQ